MSNTPMNKSTPVNVNKKSEPDHESVLMMRYGITRELKYTYFCGAYRYDSLKLAIAQAIRIQDQNT